MITYSPKSALRAARDLPDLRGHQARYVPNLSPGGPELWPVSDHSAVRLEAWATATSDEAARALDTGLAALPGAGQYGWLRPDGRRRPYAWVILPGDGSYCDHVRERWHK